MKTEVLHSIYYNPDNAAAFSSKKKLIEAAKQIDPSITPAFVEDWLKQQLTYTLHKPIRRNFKRNFVVAKGIDDQFQADLVDLRQYKSQNNGYQYVLTVIDVFSKYAFAIPLLTKSAKNVCDAFKKIFHERKPIKLQTDQGVEFVNAPFRKLCKDYNINFFTTTDSDVKCSIVERFNRTLKTKMWKYFTFKGTRKYIDVLHKLVNAYNKTVHRSHGMKPIDVSEDNESAIFKRLYGFENFRELLKSRITNTKIREGDSVRIQYSKGPLEKGYFPNWTDTLEKVDKVIKGDRKPFYQLSNITGRFYPEEIQQVKPDLFRIEKIIKRRTRKGVKEVLVKWLGFPDSYNSWEPEENIVYNGSEL